jgi:uncharacterized protein YciI
MHYIVFARDADGAGELRSAHRQEHVEYWNQQGNVVLVAGAMMSGDDNDAVPVGSSFLLSASSEDAVKRLIADDPFTVCGVFGAAPQIQRVRPAIGELWPR